MTLLFDNLIRMLGGYTESEYEKVTKENNELKIKYNTILSENNVIKNEYETKLKQPNFGTILQQDTSYPVPDDSLKLEKLEVKNILQRYYPNLTSIKLDDGNYWKVDIEQLKKCWFMKELAKPNLKYSTYFDCNGFSSLCYSVCSLVADGKLAVGDVNGYAQWTGDGYHAFNMFIDLDGKPVLYEPQLNKFYDYDKAEIKWVHF